MKSGRIVLAGFVIIFAFTTMITTLAVASRGAEIESSGFHRFFLEKFGTKGMLLSAGLGVSLVVAFIWSVGRRWPSAGSALALAFLLIALVDFANDLNFLLAGFSLFGKPHVFRLVVVPVLVLASWVLFLFTKVKPFRF